MPAAPVVYQGVPASPLPPIRICRNPGAGDAGNSLSHSIPARAARPARVRRVPCGVRCVARSGVRARCCPAGPRRRAGRHSDQPCRNARRHVAPSRTQGHRSRLSPHASRRPTPDSAGRTQRACAAGKALALDRSRRPRSKRAADDPRRAAPRATPQRVCDRVAPAGKASRGCAGLRNREGTRQARRPWRIYDRSTQPRRAAAHQRHLDHTGAVECRRSTSTGVARGRRSRPKRARSV